MERNASQLLTGDEIIVAGQEYSVESITEQCGAVVLDCYHYDTRTNVTLSFAPWAPVQMLEW